jgi:hypothetical protein
LSCELEKGISESRILPSTQNEFEEEPTEKATEWIPFEIAGVF